ncbi:ARABIDOPSIS THALIANA HIGH AFFINITY K+ TRANSPORTER 5, high affinity K+ transporter 5 [Hibiscus trionum]|uniref:Potassium transporter n=1 Tax=Hibiscus trionum TaxID=183268 RepID=A0A9W7IIZ2_HIBTR|nr:ARABIDOPSIS THALIANA HIGH AFFINITY K+ TRANSPORTER 5, high affinity K+ transporter 5 [Hibiscus trionum]
MSDKGEKGDEDIEFTPEGEKKGQKQRKSSWAKLRHVDSFNVEAGRILSALKGHNTKSGWVTTVSLAFQSIGVVYGDIGTSPLYTFAGIFPDGIEHPEHLLGALSLILYSIILMPFLKYTFVVLNANDNGEGGTFALYSLLCRHNKVSLLPNQQPEDRELSNYKLEIPSSQTKRAHYIRGKLENSETAKVALFLFTVLGVSMVMGDGTLTPAMSVLSAVGGIESLGEDAVVGISVVILFILFYAQRFGTDKVGFSFAPILTLWFILLVGIGFYNLNKYGWGVLRAFNPYYIVVYFRGRAHQAWISLGGVILSTTGTEAMFADLGHFSVRAIQLSFSFVVLPALLVAYCGQAAYLTKNPADVLNTFYKSVPGPFYWPTFVIAVLAAIIASQAMISGVFSIITQSLSVGCFPRVKVVHTSDKYEGQVYIPDLNYLIMTLCILITVGFRNTDSIGHAYGIAVVAVMFISTSMVSLIMLVVWKTNILLVILFFGVFAFIELTYLSSVLSKFVQGGYLPLAFSFVMMSVMAIWHYAYKKRYEFELKNKVSGDYIKQLARDPRINRVPGVGLFYSELVHGIPPIFPHFISSIPSVHSVLVFVSIKKLPICKIAPEERFLFRYVEPREYRMYRCIVRYGYMDVMGTTKEFEHQLLDNLKDFIRNEYFITQGGGLDEGSGEGSGQIQGVEEEIRFIERSVDEGIIYLLGETKVMAKQNASMFKKVIVDYIYTFLRNNFRQGETEMMVPHTRLLRVGMTFEI